MKILIELCYDEIMTSKKTKKKDYTTKDMREMVDIIAKYLKKKARKLASVNRVLNDMTDLDSTCEKYDLRSDTSFAISYIHEFAFDRNDLHDVFKVIDMVDSGNVTKKSRVTSRK